MNDTLLRILQSREDISEYLFHFTKGCNAKDVLIQIADSKSIIDINNNGVICFSESPLTMLCGMFQIFERYDQPLYSPYGIALKKEYLYNMGARPVIYGASTDKKELSKNIDWLFEQYIPNKKDFSWLREWRIRASKIELTSDNCFFITKQKDECQDIMFSPDDIENVEFDGCVSDGKFDGHAYAVLSKRFKCVSLEEIISINNLTKNEFEDMVKKQSMDEKGGISLGWV